jgi:hypothetical protein
METKFKKGQVVLYQNGTSFELGIVKEVIAPRMYRVWYHTGDTSALTDESNLHELKNAYAFLIMRRKADTSSIDETPARQLAASIIDETSQLTELEGEAYYECEDVLTELINEFKI